MLGSLFIDISKRPGVWSRANDAVSADSADSVNAECAAVLDELVAKVAKVTQQEVYLLEKLARPHCCLPLRLLKHLRYMMRDSKEFTERVCAIDGVAETLVRLADGQRLPHARSCFMHAVTHVPSFAAKLSDAGAHRPLLRAAVRDADIRDREVSFRCLALLAQDRSVCMSVAAKMAREDEFVQFMMTALDDDALFASSVFSCIEAPRMDVFESLFAQGRSDTAAELFREMPYDEWRTLVVDWAASRVESWADALSVPRKGMALADDFLARVDRCDLWTHFFTLPDRVQVDSFVEVFDQGSASSTARDVFRKLSDINRARVFMRTAKRYEPWHVGVKERTDGLNMAYDAYVNTVGIRLSDAFYRDGYGHLLVDADSLAKVAVVCELEGPGALQALEPHLERERARREATAKTADMSTAQEWKRTDARLKKAREMLCRPTASLKLRFAESMPSTPLPVVTGTVVSMPVATVAAPLALDAYLRKRVVPRSGCAKCTVARGPDTSVRTEFANEGGNGRSKDVTKKRACPLADHAISIASDGVPLLEQYEREYRVRVGGRTTKRQKFYDFMACAYGVEPLGPAPSHKVTLYSAPRVATSLEVLDERTVKLDLVAIGHRIVETSKDNYAGFRVT
jgi:hypothetical protein